ncbi:MAG: MMPL family transporter, partial [Steroidobacteraceae bacterium]
EGLKDALLDTLQSLSSPTGLALADLLPRDPTGELAGIGERLEGSVPRVRTIGGVWTSADGQRALLVARTAATGADTDGQQAALGALNASFDALSRGDARLVVSGPAVFAVQARESIIREAMRLSVLGSVLTLALLLYVYRSPVALALGLVPVASGALAGVAAVAAGFGLVHGLTLGFGITLIGEAVDYAIYLFVQAGRDGNAETRTQWLRDFWPTVRLGMLTSLCGFAALLASGFPGLAQLGLYSVAGLLAAALVTRHVLPILLPASFRVRDLDSFGDRIRRVVQRMRGTRSGFTVVVLLAAAAATVLAASGDDLWQKELSSLSPVPLESQLLDAKMRSELGAPDVRQVVIVSGDDREQVLQRAEATHATLQRLVENGVISGFESPAHYLPSLATQQARLSALPETAELRQRLAAATRDLPVRATTLEPFVADVDAARVRGAIDETAFGGTSFAIALDSLLLHGSQGWRAMLPLRSASEDGNIDAATVARALDAAGVTGARLLDLKAESDALYRGYLDETMRLSLWGSVALLVVLLIALRSPARVIRIALPLALSVVCTAALLHAGGRALSLLHLVGLLLTVAIGSNYALFFDGAAQRERGLDEPRTYASVVLASITSVLGFGVLATSSVPVLQALGETVTVGGVLALLFSAVLIAPPPKSPA